METQSPKKLRRSAIQSEGNGKGLSHPQGLVKLGIKGRNLAQWAQSHGIELPAKLYDVMRVGDRGVLARVGSEEIIFECEEGDTLLAKFEQALNESLPDIFRIEQQSETIELAGEKAVSVLAQTCGVNFLSEPPSRIVYTRIAGASCGIIPLGEGGHRIYRIWIDYTLAPYLWEILTEIVNEN